MTVAFLFPGQGTPHVDDALRFTARSLRGRALLEHAAHAAETPMEVLMRGGGVLDRTEVLQPVLTAIALFVAGELSAGGVTADVVLGHSLGELAAWAAAGGIDEESAVRVAALRGNLMARAASTKGGGLVAIGTSDPAAIDEALALGRSAGTLAVAAFNSPDETVLGGDEAALRAVLGASRVRAVRVPTGGPWHTPAMAPAVEPLRTALSRASPGALRSRFIEGRTGGLAPGADLPSDLAEQVALPVRFRDAMATAARLADDVVLIAPGALLRSLARRNWRAQGPRLWATDGERALEATLHGLGGPR